MNDFRNILAALAFSNYCQDIFNYAADLAGRLEANLILGSIIDSRDVKAVQKISSMGYDVDGEHYIEGIRKEREILLEEYLKESSFPQDRIKTIFRVGHPVDELLKIVIQEEVDLVVTGIKGRSEVEYIFTGSVAEKMFRRSPVPVLVYRHGEQAERLKQRIRMA
jgi:nucleotide-binding universal stress UspA family protein